MGRLITSLQYRSSERQSSHAFDRGSRNANYSDSNYGVLAGYIRLDETSLFVINSKEHKLRSYKAIFSFLNFTPGNEGQRESWSISKKIWIHYRFAVPLICLTIARWFT